MHTHIFHSISSPLTLTNPAYNLQTPCSKTMGDFNPIHILEQIPLLIVDAFQRRHHYIFRTLSFKNVLKTFMLVPKGYILLICYDLISLYLLLTGEGSTLLFIFCLPDLCVDGIHLAYPLFFTFLWRKSASIWCSY